MARDCRFLDFNGTLHISHRGGAKLGPENTMPTFMRAVNEFKTEMLELDVHCTSDGVIVVHHDANVDRVTNGSGPLREKTMKELLALDAGHSFSPDGGKTYPCRGMGYRIPELQEVLSTFRDMRFHVDVKQNEPAIENYVVQMLDDLGMADRACVGSTCDVIGRRVHKIAGKLATFPGESGVRWIYALNLVGLLRFIPISYPLVSAPRNTDGGRRVVTRSLVERLHAVGKKIFVWVVDTEEEQRMMLEYGVDGIMTDRPDVLRRTMEAFRNE